MPTRTRPLFHFLGMLQCTRRAKRKGKLHIVALGGSVVAPDTIDLRFLKQFRSLVQSLVRKGQRFIIVIGGGGIARTYQDAARKVDGKAPDVELDTIGMRATRLNAELVRIAFWPNVHPDIINTPEKLLHIDAPVAIAAGWMPGYSTDTVAVRVAEELGEKQITIAGAPAYVYDRDMKKHPNAKAIKELTWEEYLDIVPAKWRPGMPAPVDPVAARRAARMGICASVVRAKSLKELEALFLNKPFRGTTIR